MNRYSLLLNDLKSQLKYDPLSGSFIRKVRSSKSVKIGDKAGYVDGYGYITLSLNGIKYQSHRLAWFYMTGNWPERIDHIDHDRQNNRWSNLREVTDQENQRNHKLHKDNTSGVCGITWDKNRNKWMAQININKKHKFLGRYSNFFDACCARKSAEIKYDFHPNHGIKS